MGVLEAASREASLVERPSTPTPLLHHIVNLIHTYSGPTSQYDDITMLAVRRAE